jgi:hypothetical protein
MARSASALTTGRRIRDGWWLEILVAALLAFLVWRAVPVWTLSDTEISHFPVALDWVIGDCPTRGCQVWTPGRLNHEQPGRSDIGSSVRYVGSNVASTGPFVVSVHLISGRAIAVVALGDNGRCYSELSDNGRFEYQDLYAKFPRGTHCDGLAASLSSVHLGSEPS